MLYAIERLAYRHAGVVTTLTDAMRDRIIARVSRAEKVERLGLWVDPAILALGAGEPDDDPAGTWRRRCAV